MHRLPGRNPPPRGMKTTNKNLRPALLAVTLALICQPAMASIIVGGNTNVPNVMGFPNSPLNTQPIVQIGIDSTGSLQATNGASLQAIDVHLGENANGKGKFTIDNSTADVRQVFVGVSGQGEMSINNHAQLDSVGADIGRLGSAGYATVSDNSAWDNEETLFVGTFGHGALEVKGNSLVSTDTLSVGWGTTGQGGVNIHDASTVLVRETMLGYQGTGTVYVDGTNSSFINAGDLTIGGKNGFGVLTVNDGAQAYVYGETIVGKSQDAFGRIYVDDAGSVMDTMGQDITVGLEGRGELNVTKGGHLFTGSASVGEAHGSTGEVSVTGGGVINNAQYDSTWNVNGQLYVGNYGEGAMTIAQGGKVKSNGHAAIGRLEESTGSVVVSGLGSQWQNSGGMAVGDFGTGSLDVNDNAAVSTSQWMIIANAGKGDVNINNGYVTAADVILGYSQSGKGNIAVSNDGDLNVVSSLTIGDRGEGAIIISSGSRLHQSDGDMVLGNHAGSQGTLAVSEATSSVEADYSDMTVGKGGNGNLFVSNGASMRVEQLVIGDQAGSNGFAGVFGSQNKNSTQWDATLDVKENLVVGNAGHATLDINDQGQVNSNGAIVANQSGSEATVYVSGEGTRWKNNNSLSVGDSGKANVTIHSGGMLDNRGNTIVGNNKDSSGQLNLQNNGHMITATLVAGNQQGSTGEINVSGQGSKLTSNGGTIIVANKGQATLSITDQGAVRTSLADVVVANQAGSTGTLNFGIGNGTSFMFGSPDMVADVLLDIDGDMFLGTNFQGLPGGTALFDMQLDTDFNTVAIGSSFILASYEHLFGSFDNLFDNDLSDGVAWLVDGFNFNIFYDFDFGNGLKGLVAQYLGTDSPVTDVSEPGAFALMLLGLLAIFCRSMPINRAKLAI
jgi:T5SS/PEP-CTERM-associated repeat protein